MRLSKGQLKRIIREEYSRLKRRGLIREMAAATGKDVTVTFEDYESGGTFTCTLDRNLYNAIIDERDPDEQMYLMQDLYTMCEEEAGEQGVMLGAPLDCSCPICWKLIQKAAQYF